MLFYEHLHLSRGHALPFMLALAFSGACGQDGYADRLLGRDAASPSGPVPAEDAGVSREARCRPVLASEPLPARELAMQGGAGGRGSEGVYIADLFSAFKTHCGDCHTDGRNNGGFDVKITNFGEAMGEEVLARIRSEDPTLLMPPPTPGKPQRFSEREANDPLVGFAARLAEWQTQGKPAVFYPTTEDTRGTGGDSPYTLPSSVGMALTNIGNCIPDGVLLADDATSARMAELDAQFEKVRSFADLPKSLRDTDLTTLDSDALARSHIYAYAPTYTLWADNAKKLRHVRVPLGTQIGFDRAAQTFDIPENTRFYKTFMKRVVDLRGNVRYRKLETRLIITRRDPEPADGADYAPAAIFGSYAWNDDETEATLLAEPYRDGTGFADHIETILVDEQLEDEVLRDGGDDLGRMLEIGAKRNYAIPGSDRCIHCHMGAPGNNFVLGFTPLQVHRRPNGEGGVIEAAEEHELDQLERFIGYGLIAGMRSARDVVPLEDSQPGRAPRNAHELRAQGYMLGNCAHCHNPRGFPSVRERSLADVLNFEPGREGGIFEFPLDKFSPRTFRGSAQDILVPYITPSLFDHPVALAANRDFDGVKKQGLKWIEDVSGVPGPEPAADNYPNLEFLPLFQGRPLLAPWRSLIYRNVDAPFSYEDGATIFPHMPMDTPGYDCRARQVLGSWMVSIPARLVSGLPADLGEMSDGADQPYSEVRSDDPEFQAYLDQATSRLARFQSSERYHDCPLPQLDVLAPEVTSGSSVVPKAQTSTLEDADGEASERYALLSPARAHYPRTDLHDDKTWIIRRDDWFKVLVETGVDEGKAASDPLTARASELAIATARSLKLSPALRQRLLTPVPFALWDEKPTCSEKLADQRRVRDFAGDDRPQWMELTRAADTRAVYRTSPGAQVFTAVCSKCHGPDATGRSALASTIADLTGGLTRVANLRDGVFGPLGAPGQNAATRFAVADGRLDGSAQDWEARYLAWMGLGGTNAAIPRTVLSQIGSAKVFGASRKGSLGAIDAKSAANMLGVVKEACMRFLPETQDVIFDAAHGRPQRARNEAGAEIKDRFQFSLEDHSLIATNGDADLWEALCRLDNPQPLRVVRIDTRTKPPRLYVSRTHDENRIRTQGKAYYAHVYDRTRYPTDAPVGDHRGAVVTGVTAENLAPWCVMVSSDPNEGPEQSEALAVIERAAGRTLPRCPVSFLDRFQDATTNELLVEDGERWAMRGAANAGLAVYYYLDALAKGEVKPQPAFDKCEDL